MPSQFSGRASTGEIIYGVQSPPREAGGVNVTLPPGMAAAFEKAVTESGKSPGEVIGAALALYIMAREAHSNGKSVGVALSPESLETEFVGI
jgi:hypothetical protein